MTLRHLVLTTGLVLYDGPAEAQAVAVDLLRPAVGAGGGPVPGMPGWSLHVLAPRDRRAPVGAAYFSLSPRPEPERAAVFGMACWAAEAEAAAWETLLAGYLGQRLLLQEAMLWRPPPSRPPGALPWLATWLTPLAPAAGLRPERWTGGIERAVAWALMAGSG